LIGNGGPDVNSRRNADLAISERVMKLKGTPISDGKMIEHWVVRDDLTMLRQLGTGQARS
jgi:hypothetical protein